MTRSQAINILEKHHRELTVFLNDAYVSGVLNEQGKLWIRSSIYGIMGVISNLQNEEHAERSNCLHLRTTEDHVCLACGSVVIDNNNQGDS